MSPSYPETLYKVAVEIFREPEIRRRSQYAGKRRVPLTRIEERTKTVPESELPETLAAALQLATVTYAGHRAHVSCTRVHVTVSRPSLGGPPEDIYP